MDVSENLGYVMAANVVERAMESGGLSLRCLLCDHKSLDYSEPW